VGVPDFFEQGFGHGVGHVSAALAARGRRFLSFALILVAAAMDGKLPFPTMAA
jgi:hypothetical protein